MKVMKSTQIKDIRKNPLKKVIALVAAAIILSCFMVSTKSVLAVSAANIAFNTVTVETNVKVIFPEGQNIVATYDLGMPLAAEKALLEPDFFYERR